jgi:UDP-N-acetylglucosamine diphosphorylase/glucosamine-1-phosphate N-acetyltransferase
MNYILFDDLSWDNLLPLTFTRPTGEIRIGILKISEKWNLLFNTQVSFLTQDYLSEKYSSRITQDNILINGSVLPDNDLLIAINNLKTGQILQSNDFIIAVRSDNKGVEKFIQNNLSEFQRINAAFNPIKIQYPWDIFTYNEKALIDDFNLITKGRKSQVLSPTNKAIGAENIFIEEGAIVEYATINAKNGPVYIGKDAEIMEGALIRGPLALCEHSVLKLGAKIYGATTIGPHSKVGGEVHNSVIFGYSNKAHDGFLGNSVLGEWCNLGADTNNSNLKNNYALVKVWNYPLEKFINTNLQFCGLIMGDHSKSGINTMFNTGTVVGVSANIFGAGFPRNFIPSFSWGGPQGMTVYTMPKAYEVAGEVMKRRKIEFSETEKKILTAVFEKTEKYRRF